MLMDISVVIEPHGLSSENPFGIAILQVLTSALDEPNAFWATPSKFCLYANTDEDVDYLRSWILCILSPHTARNLLSEFDD